MPAADRLERRLSLRGAVALNLLDMVGVGPFITLPLILAAMGGPQAMLGWVLGALLAVCDGLVWAELGAAMPEAGGSYHFLRRIYPGGIGRWLSFVFVSQLLLSAPLSIASGAIGLSQYASFLVPRLADHAPPAAGLHVAFGPMNLIAVAVIAVAGFLLFRGLGSIQRLSIALSGVVLATMLWVIVTAMVSPAAHWREVFVFPHGAFRPDAGFLGGLATAMLLATYDYWGYYNVTFLGAEVKEPARTIPRAILLSIAICAVLYVALNLSVLAVLPWQGLLEVKNIAGRRAVISSFTEAAYLPMAGAAIARRLAQMATVLVMITAFASVFALLLGYSRIPFAAAREGGFPAVFGRLHRGLGVPYVSLLTLAGTAMLFCFFSLGEVIAALVVLRILLQFLLQHIGVMVLRRSQPEMVRPFRLWWYPVPPLIAMAGFLYILFARPHFARELVLAGGVVTVATVLSLTLRRDGRIWRV